MTPNPPELDETQREEARQQTSANVDGALDLAGSVVDASASARGRAAAGRGCGAALDATVTVAKVSLDVVGGNAGRARRPLIPSRAPVRVAAAAVGTRPVAGRHGQCLTSRGVTIRRATHSAGGTAAITLASAAIAITPPLPRCHA